MRELFETICIRVKIRLGSFDVALVLGLFIFYFTAGLFYVKANSAFHPCGVGK